MRRKTILSLLLTAAFLYSDNIPFLIKASAQLQIDMRVLPSKHNNNGWIWMSFPVLDRLEPTINEKGYLKYDGDMAGFLLYDLFVTSAYSELFEIVWIHLVKGSNIKQYIKYMHDGWVNTDHIFFSYQGYKIKMVGENPVNLPVSGFLEDPTTPIRIYAGQENWVGYFLEESKKPLKAFEPEVLEHLTSITAQHWYLKKINGVWSSHSTAGRLDYGGMYILETDTDITFQWESSALTVNSFTYTETENFEYEELAEYTPVLIDTIDNGETVDEVGVFIGDECVGAEKVTEYPVHLRVYNGTEPIDDLSFEVVREGTGARLIEGSDAFSTLERADVRHIEMEIADNQKPIYRVSLTADDLRQISTLPGAYQLRDNYPNPFNPTTTITYDLPEPSDVTIRIYDMKGRQVAEPVNGNMPIGTHEVMWDASNYASGVYFVRMSSNDFTETKKIMLIK